MNVTLNETEKLVAEFIGKLRNDEAIRNGKKDKYGFNGEGIRIHTEGVAGEIAAAKAMNLYFPCSVNTYRKESDLFHDVEVKTRSSHNYDLLVRQDDNNDFKFVLVTGIMPEYQVHGWMYGKEAKQERWVRNYGGRPPAYFVPKEELKSILELYKIICLEKVRSLRSPQHLHESPQFV